MIPYINMMYSKKTFNDDVEEYVDIEANDGYIKDNKSINACKTRDSSQTESGNILSSLCSFAIEKYGPSFLSVVKSVIPFVEEINTENKINTEEYLNYVLLNNNIELGYTRKELKMMNDPILEFVSTLPANSPGQESSIFNQRINTALDYFYKEINEDCYAS